MVRREAHASFPGHNGLIAFTTNGSIFVVQPDGEGVREIRGGGHSSGAAWSPNGRKIAFICHGSDHIYSRRSQICVMSADGSDVKVVTRTTQGKEDPAWAPDGRRIVFSMGDPEDHPLFIVRKSGRHFHRLTPPSGEDRDPTWSPDGRWIVFSHTVSGGTDLYKIRPNGRQMRAITTTIGRREFNPNYAPGGQRLTFGRDGARGYRIWVSRSDGSHAHALTGGRRGDFTPAWSPNGRWIVFTRAFERLMKVRPDGSDLQLIYRSPDGAATSPDWQPKT